MDIKTFLATILLFSNFAADRTEASGSSVVRILRSNSLRVLEWQVGIRERGKPFGTKRGHPISRILGEKAQAADSDSSHVIRVLEHSGGLRALELIKKADKVDD